MQKKKISFLIRNERLSSNTELMGENTKKFESKSLDHISSYKIVKSSKEYLLSYDFINKLYQYVFGFLNQFLIKVTQFSFIYRPLTFFDEAINAYVLNNFDKVLAHLPRSEFYSPRYHYNNATGFVSTRVLAPINRIIYNTGDKFLPATLNENKPVFKLEELLETSEVSKFFKIINELLSRTRLWVSSKSNTVSERVIADYNEGIESLQNEESNIKKRIIASYNTGAKLVNDVHSSYIQPLRSQTQDYVSDVAKNTKSKAESYISDAKNGISQMNGRAENLEKDVVNGNVSNPIVSTSA